MEEKNLYFFVADVHLGLDFKDPVGREKKFSSFLYNLPAQTKEVFLMGDIFDFWYEYKDVIPNGFTRTLGAIAALVDRGVKVHFFNGNHDIWTYRYFQKELGVVMEKQPAVIEIEGKRFCLGHGDGLWSGDPGYKFLKSIFYNRILQILFSGIHPRWAFLLGHSWSKHNRLTRGQASAEGAQRTINKCIAYSEDFQKKYAAAAEERSVSSSASQPASATKDKIAAAEERSASGMSQTVGKKIDYFIFGHFHIPAHKQLADGSELFMLGDWIYNPDYVVFDGETGESHSL
jgi:UDP-2,3-diacylglucosamine hydrolase